LLVSGFAAGRASNASEQFPISHKSRVQRAQAAPYLASTSSRGRKWVFLKPKSINQLGDSYSNFSSHSPTRGGLS
jgi:hypothetical protein